MGEMNERQAKKACRRYYLECKPVAEIAQELGVSRAAVLAAIDDPGRQAEYLGKAENARRRLRARAAAAADAALEKQVAFLEEDVVDAALKAEQQRTADRVLRLGLQDEASGQEITLRFAHGMPELGMPRGTDYAEQRNAESD